MKTLLFPLAFVSALCLSKSHIYSQDIVWERSYGGKHAEYLMDVQPTADYGFILAGSSLSNKTGNKTDENRGDFDYWIWKMDESGELDWQKSFGGSGSDFLQSLKNTRDGGFILAGNSNSSNVTEKKGQNDKKEKSRGGDDFWIIKLDAKGNEEWQKTIGGWGQEKLKTICQTVDGGYIIGGSSSSHISGEKEENGFGNLDYWIVKLDKKGKIEWQKTFGGIYVDELRSLEQTKDLGYIVGGYSNSPKSGNKEKDNLGYGDYWVLKLDPKGEIEWQKVLGGDLDDQLSVVHQSYDGAYLLAGYSSSDATESRVIKGINGSDFWVVKLNEIGNVLWQEKYDIGDLDKLTSLVENKDHSLLLG
ncbi:MAG: T9SS C-terminal target domain-containing protein, partial [Flavobacterium sp.]